MTLNHSSQPNNRCNTCFITAFFLVCVTLVLLFLFAETRQLSCEGFSRTCTLQKSKLIGKSTQTFGFNEIQGVYTIDLRNPSVVIKLNNGARYRLETFRHNDQEKAFQLADTIEAYLMNPQSPQIKFTSSLDVYAAIGYGSVFIMLALFFLFLGLNQNVADAVDRRWGMVVTDLKNVRNRCEAIVRQCDPRLPYVLVIGLLLLLYVYSCQTFAHPAN